MSDQLPPELTDSPDSELEDYLFDNMCGEYEDYDTSESDDATSDDETTEKQQQRLSPVDEIDQMLIHVQPLPQAPVMRTATTGATADRPHAAVESNPPTTAARGRKKGQVGKIKRVKDKNTSKIKRVRKRLPADYIQNAVDRQIAKVFQNINDPIAQAFARMLKPVLDEEIPLAISKAQVLKNVAPPKVSSRSVANPFILYQLANMARIKQENSQYKQMKEFSRHLSEEWHRMSTEDKKPYYDQYAVRRKLHADKLRKEALVEFGADATLDAANATTPVA